MKTKTDNLLLHVLGKALALPLRGLSFLQRPLLAWLMGKGLSAVFAARLLTFINLCLISFTLLWLLPHWVVVAAGILCILTFISGDLDFIPPPPIPQAGLRDGWAGYGLYDSFDVRLDEDDETTPYNDNPPK